jgi:hypothetical protein
MVHLNGSSLQITNVNREPKSSKVSAKLLLIGNPNFIGGAASHVDFIISMKDNKNHPLGN